MDIWVVSTFRLLQIKLLWIFVYKCLCEYVLLFLLGKSLGMKWSCHMTDVWFFFHIFLLFFYLSTSTFEDLHLLVCVCTCTYLKPCFFLERWLCKRYVAILPVLLTGPIAGADPWPRVLGSSPPSSWWAGLLLCPKIGTVAYLFRFAVQEGGQLCSWPRDHLKCAEVILPLGRTPTDRPFTDLERALRYIPFP